LSWEFVVGRVREIVTALDLIIGALKRVGGGHQALTRRVFATWIAGRARSIRGRRAYFVDWRLIVIAMSERPGNGEGTDKGVDGSERAAIERLLELGRSARLFRAGDGRLFARVPIENRSEVYGLKSDEFRDWLVGGYFRDCGALPSDGAVRRVVAALEAFARFGDGTPPVFIRVAGSGKSDSALSYFDLGDASGQAVEIGAGGWSIVERPVVDFRRPRGLLALPEPSREGSIELLRPYVNLTERDFRLLVVWMAAALRPVGPYPILALYGEQATAKSTLIKIIRRLIDPQEVPVLLVPGSTLDLMVTAVNGWLLAYDNISVIPTWLSDGLCVLSTGGGVARRALFSNDEKAAIHAQRPVILGGIEEYVRRGDLSDRCVFLNLPELPPDQRRREVELWHAFSQDLPRILGGLLDAIASGLRELPSVKLAELPRMADFAAFAEAVGRGLGWEAGTVIADYNANRQDATAMQIEDSVLAAYLVETACTPGRILNWHGTATEMFAELCKVLGKKVTSSAGWPKTPRGFSNELRRIAPQLRTNGVFVAFEKRREKRIIFVTNLAWRKKLGIA
jgi:hypothetical protein